MKKIDKLLFVLSMTLFTLPCFAQQAVFTTNPNFKTSFSYSRDHRFLILGKNYLDKYQVKNALNSSYTIGHHSLLPFRRTGAASLVRLSSSPINRSKIDLKITKQEYGSFFDNRRNVYSSMWAFASLNYLYADLVGLMDANVLAQYQKGVVNDTEITPEFLTVAAGFMQIPLANVFLPQVIKNEKTLRWVQIASGTVMSLVQAGTLFVGKPTPYYALFSVFEIAATSYITIDAIKWKPNSKKKRQLIK